MGKFYKKKFFYLFLNNFSSWRRLSKEGQTSDPFMLNDKCIFKKYQSLNRGQNLIV